MDDTAKRILEALNRLHKAGGEPVSAAMIANRVKLVVNLSVQQ
jgi:hypothetical protein